MELFREREVTGLPDNFPIYNGWFLIKIKTIALAKELHAKGKSSTVGSIGLSVPELQNHKNLEFQFWPHFITKCGILLKSVFKFYFGLSYPHVHKNKYANLSVILL